MNDDIDPVDEIRAGAIQEEYKTLDAYMAHMKEIPSVDECLRRVRGIIKGGSSPKPRTAKSPARRRKAERFIMLIQREPFDYTRWQENLFANKSMETIFKEAAALRAKTEKKEIAHHGQER